MHICAHEFTLNLMHNCAHEFTLLFAQMEVSPYFGVLVMKSCLVNLLRSRFQSSSFFVQLKPLRSQQCCLPSASVRLQAALRTGVLSFVFYVSFSFSPDWDQLEGEEWWQARYQI